MLFFVNRTLRNFKNEEDGTAAIEFLLVMPLMMWALMSTYVYFDAYRVEANSNRASLALAEMFSREEVAITDPYLDGAQQLLNTLTFEESGPEYRVTTYQYDPGAGTYHVVWSRNRGMSRNLTDADLATVTDRLPIMNAIEHYILVETVVEYDAPFSIGLGPFNPTDLSDLEFDTFTVIRPRQSRLCFDETPADPLSGVTCEAPGL